MKIYIENQTHDTKDGAHHMPLHTQETTQKRAILCDLVKKSRGGGMFLPSRGGSQGGHVSSFETGGGALAWRVHWHGGSIGIGGGGGVVVLHT